VPEFRFPVGTRSWVRVTFTRHAGVPRRVGGSFPSASVGAGFETGATVTEAPSEPREQHAAHRRFCFELVVHDHAQAPRAA